MRCNEDKLDMWTSRSGFVLISNGKMTANGVGVLFDFQPYKDIKPMMSRAFFWSFYQDNFSWSHVVPNTDCLEYQI